MWVKSSMSVTEAARVGGSCSICAGERRSGQFCISALHGPSIWGARTFSVRGWIQDAWSAACLSRVVSGQAETRLCANKHRCPAWSLLSMRSFLVYVVFSRPSGLLLLWVFNVLEIFSLTRGV